MEFIQRGVTERIVSQALRLLPSFLASLSSILQLQSADLLDDSELLHELYGVYDSSTTDVSEDELLLCCLRALVTLTKGVDLSRRSISSTGTDLLTRGVWDGRLIDLCFKVMSGCRKARLEEIRERDSTLPSPESTGKVPI